MNSKLNDIGILLCLLCSSTLGIPEQCTVDLLLQNIDESDVDANTLLENQNVFYLRCSEGCAYVEFNGIVREQCSIEKAEDNSKYAVYRCPNDATQFYIADFNVNKCYLKYYTLCDDTASYNDDNLDDIVRDLLCGCNPDYFMYYIGNDACTTVFDTNKGLFCKLAGTNYIAHRFACRASYEFRCIDERDLENKRFKCDDYGFHCTSKDGVSEKYFDNNILCDGYADCGDSKDEMNCATDKGIYCDEDSENPKEFVKFAFICDGFIDCQDSEADELPSKCSNKCKPVNGDVDEITLTDEMICNGVVDCADMKDEEEEMCPDKVSCDSGTKWIKKKYLCQNHNLCDDTTDMDETRWNCSNYEICPNPHYNPLTDTYLDETVLCDTSIFCLTNHKITQSQEENCMQCDKGGHNSPERCSDSDNGIVCYDSNNKNVFVPNISLCDGTKNCNDGSDEENCKNGIYCDQQSKFIRWDQLCDGNKQCIDGVDENEHCQSNFFDLLKDNDDSQFESVTDYLNPDIYSELKWIGREEQYKKSINHNIFACQEFFYNMEGPKARVITTTIKENCIPEEKFSCTRVYDARFTVSKQIMKSWLCDYSSPGIYCISGSEHPRNVEINTCRKSHLCYAESMRCDGDNDCTDGKDPEDVSSDEIGCEAMGLRCGGSSNKTVEDAYICDGYNDCKSEVDEFLCYYSHQESESTNCQNNRSDGYTLYSKFIPSYGDQDSITTVRVEQVTEHIVESCDCEKLKGGKYLAAVCNTVPGASNQPCSDSNTYNNKLCYPELNSTWFNDNYRNIDNACKSLTRTLIGLSSSSKEAQYRTYVKFPNREKKTDADVFLEKSVFCKDPNLRKRKRCGVELENMCNLMNDCGDWSDERTEFCPNNFECKNDETVSRVISISQRCNGVSDCDHAQDECLDLCNQDALTNIERILGHDAGLLVVVWLFGGVSLFFNFYIIVSMTRSAFAILEKMPHRFIYRILVATIAFGDIMISIYLVILACVDSFRTVKYCENKEQWLTGSTCLMMGVLSTFGNHVSLFAMVTLSVFRLKTVVHYLWPRTVNRTKALRLTSLLVASILIVAMLLSVLPLVDLLKDYFVDRYYFPNRRNILMNTKTELVNTLKAYVSKAKLISPGMDVITNSSSWDILLDRADELFNGSRLIEGGKPYSFYSAYGVCLFNYLNSPKNNSFTYVITIITLNLACFLTIIASYLCIWRVGTKSRSTERQLQKKLSIAVSLNIICRLPLFALCLAHSIEAPTTQEDTERCAGTCLYYRYMSVFVIPINSVINPFINSEVPLMDLLGIRRLCNRSSNSLETAKPNGGLSTTGLPLSDMNHGKKSNISPMIVSSPLPEENED